MTEFTASNKTDAQRLIDQLMPLLEACKTDANTIQTCIYRLMSVMETSEDPGTGETMTSTRRKEIYLAVHAQATDVIRRITGADPK